MSETLSGARGITPGLGGAQPPYQPGPGPYPPGPEPPGPPCPCAPPWKGPPPWGAAPCGPPPHPASCATASPRGLVGPCWVRGRSVGRVTVTPPTWADDMYSRTQRCVRLYIWDTHTDCWPRRSRRRWPVRRP
ncbi:hypothetical protein E5Z02_04130 [Streptomyces rhizosphaericola]|uniref:Uncharacterized protein n=1 Tax=Streptomyces rhizosphaericola TaxID=2564098 RepID=A0ABY2PK93_9ACTN|nr:hypothetical protein E5Z02_04130 [Streptomyces rhizosphaericola]